MSKRLKYDFNVQLVNDAILTFPQPHFFDPHFLRTQQFADAGGDAHIGDENSNNSSINRRRDDDDDMDDDEDENDADSTNLPLNLVATQFAE